MLWLLGCGDGLGDDNDDDDDGTAHTGTDVYVPVPFWRRQVSKVLGLLRSICFQIV